MAQDKNNLQKLLFQIPSSNGVSVEVKEIKDRIQKSLKPLIMVHGGGADAITSFDLDADSISISEELAQNGFDVFLVNIRGWGKSTLPEYDFSNKNLMVGNVEEAATDILSVINWISEKYKYQKINLFGWATGGHWISYLATKHPEKINSIILLNSLYGVKGDWQLNDAYKDPENPTQYLKKSFFRESPKNTLTTAWTKTIPIENKKDWRSPEVEKAYVEKSLSFGKNPDLFVVPGAFEEESFYMAQGKQYWNARDIKVPALFIRSKYDFWSRPIDLEAFKKEFPKNIYSKFETINGTHYLFLDKEERGREELLKLIENFCQEVN